MDSLVAEIWIVCDMCSEIDVVFQCLHQSDRYCQSEEIVQIKGEWLTGGVTLFH